MVASFGIAQHAEIDEQHRTCKGVGQVMCDGDRDRRLADAASADDGDQARSGQLSRQLWTSSSRPTIRPRRLGKIGVWEICDRGRRFVARLLACDTGATKQ